MNKPLLHLSISLFLAVAMLPGIGHAAPDADDYAAVQVPNVTQAVAFFRDVMNCGVISDDSRARTALMACGRGTTIEITPLSGHVAQRSGAAAQSLTLNIDDASSVASWLRANRVQLIDAPTHLATGPDAGKVAVTFRTPWGQPLRLVSRMQADELLETTQQPSSRVAVQ